MNKYCREAWLDQKLCKWCYNLKKRNLPKCSWIFKVSSVFVHKKLQLQWPFWEGVAILPKGYKAVNLLLLQGLEFEKVFFPQGQFSNSANSHIVLSQVYQCFLWFPHLVKACAWIPATTFVSTVPVSWWLFFFFLGECQPPGVSIFGNYHEEMLLVLKLRSEDGWSVPSFTDPHYICLIWWPVMEAYERFISCSNISSLFGLLQFKSGKHLFSTSHSLHFVCPCHEMGYPLLKPLFKILFKPLSNQVLCR